MAPIFIFFEGFSSSLKSEFFRDEIFTLLLDFVLDLEHVLFNLSFDAGNNISVVFVFLLWGFSFSVSIDFLDVL